MQPDHTPFREHHLINFLDSWGVNGGALDASLAEYFRKHKSLGSKDRAEISEKVFHQIRWRLLPEGADPFDESIAPNLRVSAPEDLWNAFVRSYGEEQAFELLYTSNFAAPTTIRVNPIKISRDELFAKWKELYDISVTAHSPLGITFHRKITFFSLDDFKHGFFDVQDEASQLAADMVKLKPGDHVLDWCAGSGGKTLAYAYKSEGKGQLYLHDIRHGILLEARKRLCRAGVQNTQLLFDDEKKKLDKLKKKMDWVLVDAPCTGTGTLRRNPDMKYRFTEEKLRKIVGEQRRIFEMALSFLKPGGKIVWVTCSILKEENEDQIAHFLKTYNLEVVGEPFKSLPSKGGMDGLFAVTLASKS